MNNILEKARTILRMEEEKELCLLAGICPRCGTVLVKRWEVKMEFLWFKWMATVHGYGPSSPFVTKKCIPCNLYYTT